MALRWMLPNRTNKKSVLVPVIALYRQVTSRAWTYVDQVLGRHMPWLGHIELAQYDFMHTQT